MERKPVVMVTTAHYDLDLAGLSPKEKKTIRDIEDKLLVDKFGVFERSLYYFYSEDYYWYIKGDIRKRSLPVLTLGSYMILKGGYPEQLADEICFLPIKNKEIPAGVLIPMPSCFDLGGFKYKTSSLTQFILRLFTHIVDQGKIVFPISEKQIMFFRVFNSPISSQNF